MKSVYPVTIVEDRYNGTYSGGRYTAWNLSPWEIPDDAFGDDTSCMFFWEDNEKYNEFTVGLGDTPNEAERDLIRKMEEGECE